MANGTGSTFVSSPSSDFLRWPARFKNERVINVFESPGTRMPSRHGTLDARANVLHSDERRQHMAFRDQTTSTGKIPGTRLVRSRRRSEIVYGRRASCVSLMHHDYPSLLGGGAPFAFSTMRNYGDAFCAAFKRNGRVSHSSFKRRQCETAVQPLNLSMQVLLTN